MDKFKRDEILIAQSEVPQPQGDYALELMKHFATVAATPDGEDSSGRAKARLQTPEEVVQRACDIADLAFKELAKRDWILELPEIPAPLKSPKPEDGNVS